MWLAVEKGMPAPSTHKEDLATIGYVDPSRSIGTFGPNRVALEERNPAPSDKPSAAQPDVKTTPVAPIASSLQAAVDAAPKQSVSPSILGILTAALPVASSEARREELRSPNETQTPKTEIGPSAVLILAQITSPSSNPAKVAQLAALPSPVQSTEPEKGQGSPSTAMSDKRGRDSNSPTYISASPTAPAGSITTASRTAPIASSTTENNPSIDSSDQPAAERTKIDKKANQEAGAGNDPGKPSKGPSSDSSGSADSGSGNGATGGKSSASSGADGQAQSDGSHDGAGSANTEGTKGAKDGKSGGAGDSTQKGSDGAESSKAGGKSDSGTGSKNGSSSKGHSDKGKQGGGSGHGAKSNDGKGNGGKGDGKGSG